MGMFSSCQRFWYQPLHLFPKEEPEALQSPHETLRLQSTHDTAAVSNAEIDMQLVNSFENSLE